MLQGTVRAGRMEGQVAKWPSVSWQRCKAWNHQRHRGDDLEKAMKLSMSVSTESLRAPSSALETLHLKGHQRTKPGGPTVCLLLKGTGLQVKHRERKETLGILYHT